MKRLLLLALLVSPVIVRGQVASRLLAGQSIPLDSSATNILSVDTVAGAMNRVWAFKWSSMRVKSYQMKWWSDSLNNRMSSYTKTSVINDSLTKLRTANNLKLNKTDTTNKWRGVTWTPSYNDVRAKPTLSTVATSGNYNDLNGLPSIPSAQVNSDWNAVSGKEQILNKPNLSNYYLNSNPNGYINSVIGNLGFTPANSATTITINGSSQNLTTNRTWNVGTLVGTDTTSLSNRVNKKLAISDTLNKWKPKSYIPTLLELDGIYGYRPYNGTANSEGFLKSYSEVDPLFNTKFSTKSTTDLSEGTNKYYLDSRARLAWTLTTTGSGASTYNSGTGVLNIPTPINYTAGTGIGISSGTITNTSPNQVVNLTAGTGIGVGGSYPNYIVSSIAVTPTFNNGVVRALNTNYTISTIQAARVSYTVRVSYTITVLLGSTGVISLQYSTNGGSTFTTIATISNNLNLGLALTGYNDFNISGEIPANALVKILSTVTNATNSYQTGQEILY